MVASTACCSDQYLLVISGFDQSDRDKRLNEVSGRVDAYFRFLNLVGAIQQLPSLPKLDVAEQRLLEIVAAAWHSGNSLSVTGAMSLDAAGAPATIHRRLTRLRQKGLIDFQISCDDSRVKSIVPTKVAQDYFCEIAKCLCKASKS